MENSYITLVPYDVVKTPLGVLIKVSLLKPCLRSDVSDEVKVMRFAGGVHVIGPYSRKMNTIAPVALGVVKEELNENFSIHPYEVVFPSLESTATERISTNTMLYRQAIRFLNEKALYAE